MKLELVSVIVPVYNIRPEMLKKCIRSISRQSYKNIEIILVDDGSTDGSAEILDAFRRKDSRIQVIHKKNGGVSEARNVGLEIASGEYICFVDCDDWLPTNSIELLMRAIVNNAADFCVGTLEFFSDIHSYQVNQPINCNCMMGDSECMTKILNLMDTGPAAKIYRKLIIDKTGLRFKKGVQLGEDTLFIYQFLQNCEKICSIDSVVYYVNCCVGTSLSRGKYNADLNIVLKQCLEEYKRIFIGNVRDTFVINSISRCALINFAFLCKHYSLCLPPESYRLSIAKIKESYSLFEEHLSGDIIIEEKDLNGVSKKRLLAPFFDNFDYDSLYYTFRKDIDCIQPKTIKYIVKSTYRKFRYIYCFYLVR